MEISQNTVQLYISCNKLSLLVHKRKCTSLIHVHSTSIYNYMYMYSTFQLSITLNSSSDFSISSGNNKKEGVVSISSATVS